MAILSLWCAPEALATGLDQQVQRYVAVEALGRLVGEYHAAVAFPADRSWVEVGAAVPDADVAVMLDLALKLGLPAVHVWDSDGLRAEWTNGRPSMGPVPVSLRSVEDICPMTGASRSASCSPDGTPWGRIRLQGPQDFWYAPPRPACGDAWLFELRSQSQGFAVDPGSAVARRWVVPSGLASPTSRPLMRGVRLDNSAVSGRSTRTAGRRLGGLVGLP